MNEKGTLEFNLEDPSARKAFKRATKATDVYIALHDIANELFRPARKHGYNDKKIEELINKCPESKDEDSFECNVGVELIGLLEEKFYEMLEERGIDLSDLE